MKPQIKNTVPFKITPGEKTKLGKQLTSGSMCCNLQNDDK